VGAVAKTPYALDMAVCRSCGADLTPAARFCASCGAPVSARSGDERKVITVLFADLVGSTATGAAQDPEEFGAAIRPQLARIREALERYGGTIEKYIGDAVVAVFGAPVTREDDPERAVRAGLAIMDALGDAARVAINTGEAVVAVGAQAERGDEIVLGDVVNTAYRIEEATPAGSVFVGEATYRATREAIEYDERPPIEAKGKADPVPVWEALKARSSLPASSERTPQAPLVGRDEELTLILNTLARSRRHQSVQLVTLIGVAGIGKSRLVWELQQRLEQEAERIRWHRGRCLPYGDGVAYWALNEIVKSGAGILESDDAAAAHQKLRTSVERIISDADEAAWIEGHLRPLLALGTPEAGETRDEAFSAWRQCVEAMARRGPLVLVFEDLHWADEGLLDFIEHVADWSRSAPVLLVCTARPDLLERRPGWGGHGNALTITLPPLTSEETATLLSLLLSRSEVPDGLREALLTRAAGNPLYAEEFVRMLVERNLLVLEDDGWKLRASEVPMPESVQGIIASRLDALAPAEKALVQTAAVVGRTFLPDALAAVASVDRAEVDRTLQALVRRGIFRRYSAPVGAEGEYVFHHALVRDVAYGQIPRARRGEKHIRAAEWVEALGRPEEYAETAAHHYLAALEYVRAAGGDVEHFARPARSALKRAGERELGLNAYAAAARFFSAALELSPEEDERPELLFNYGKALSRSTAPDEEVLALARESMLAAGDIERAAECEVILGELLWRRGQRDEAFARLHDAVALLEDQRPSYAKAYALSTLAGLRIRADEAEPALEAARAAMVISDDLGLDDLRAGALNTIGVARVTTGDRGGLDDLKRSIEIAEKANSPESIRGYFNLGGMLANLGDLSAATAFHAQGHRIAERFGDAAWMEYFDAERVYKQYWSGEWEAALSLADELIVRAERGASRRLELDGCLVRGWIALARGDDDQAMADANRARDFSVESGVPQNLYPALALRARTLAATGRETEAADCAQELLRLMRERPSFPSFWAIDVAVVLDELGRGSELAAASARGPETRWLEAARAYVDSDPGRAADVLAEIGALPEEAHARMKAATIALQEGRSVDAEDELARALEFYRRVGALSYVSAAEVLLDARRVESARSF
jgi:class 3 adenylate cyclase/tetratricopeptide (TPR) repeat protein